MKFQIKRYLTTLGSEFQIGEFLNSNLNHYLSNSHYLWLKYFKVNYKHFYTQMNYDWYAWAVRSQWRNILKINSVFNYTSNNEYENRNECVYMYACMCMRERDSSLAYDAVARTQHKSGIKQTKPNNKKKRKEFSWRALQTIKAYSPCQGKLNSSFFSIFLKHHVYFTVAVIIGTGCLSTTLLPSHLNEFSTV